ncbi:MAG: hypothetical protein K6U87_03780 [Firmicutes bacterium]|nr:hypothetical protein [Bacillota bacterium]
MARRLWLGSLVALAVAVALFLARFHRVVRLAVAGPRVVWRLSFGNGPDAVREVSGVDGRRYGPLAFDVFHRHLYLLDSYGGRLLELNPAGKVEKVTALGATLGQDVVVSPGQEVYVADAHGGGVYRLAGSGLAPVAPASASRGVQVVPWRLGIRAGQLLVQWLAVGQNRLNSQLQAYSNAHPDAGSLLYSASTAGEAALKAPLVSFVVTPSGTVLLEFMGPSADSRRIREVSAQGTQGVLVRLPAKARTAELLGVDQEGRLYFGWNLSGGQEAGVSVYAPNGRLLLTWSVPPESVQAHIWGRVEPDGTLYLVENSSQAYRIVRWRVQSRQLWQWF